MVADVADVVAALRAPRYACRDEAGLQIQIQGALSAAGIESLREHRLSDRDRVDFFVRDAALGAGIAIEAKVAGTIAGVMQQLARYAESPDVHDVVLVTTRGSHRVLDGAVVAGKTVHVVVARRFV